MQLWRPGLTRRCEFRQILRGPLRTRPAWPDVPARDRGDRAQCRI